MRVHLVDPAAYTPPYDRALASALARAGAEVALFTSAFTLRRRAGRARAWTSSRRFYRWAPARGRRFARLAQHVPDMLRYRRAARRADVVHFQWLSVQALDARLLPRRAPARADRARRAPARAASRASSPAQRALYERMDAIVVHSEHGAARLRDELGLDPALVHVIRARGADRARRAGRRRRSRSPGQARGAVLRPAAALQGRRRAARGLAAGRRVDAELWIVGMPRMDVSFIHGPNVRTALRFVSARRAGGRVPRGRPRRAALPRDRPVRRAVHRARVRQAAAADAPSAASRRSRRPARRSSSRRATRTRWRAELTRAARRPEPAGADGRRLTRRGRGRVRLGRDRPPHARRSTRRSRRRPT